MMSKRWTETEKQFVIENCNIMSDEEIGNAINRSKSQVQSFRKHQTQFRRTNKKYNFQDVVKACEDRGYILLSDESVYKDALSSIKYICPKHQDKGVQTGCLGHFNEGKGCYYCGREICAEKRRVNINDKQDEYRRLCEKRNFTYIDTKRIGNDIVIEFICNNHKEMGAQYMRPGNMNREIKGCKYCAGKNMPMWYIKEVVRKNNPNVILLEDENRKNYPIKYKCRIHNKEYTSKLLYLMQGGGLPCCNGCQSNGERKVSGVLQDLGLNYEHQYSFDDCCDKNPLCFDAVILNDKNVPICAIEFDGEQHFVPIRFNDSKKSQEEQFLTIRAHDQIKNEYCEKHNIPLIRIPYYEFDNIRDILITKLKDYNII